MRSLAAILLVAWGNAVAGSLLDFLRSYDMNDYALGVAVTSSQNLYAGAENGTFAYPYLTSFRHESMTESWFVIRDGGYGFRWIPDAKWELGAIGRVKPLSLGNSHADELAGISDRKWTLELGPTIGYRGWPVHLTWTWWGEVSGRHGGYQSDLALSYPVKLARGFVVPRIHATFQNAEYNDYYFSVSPAEATPDRPAYTPGSGWNTEFDVRVGYAITPQWLLTGSIGIEWLNSQVTNSPIVGRDTVVWGNIGLAYNANIFNPPEFAAYDRQSPRFDLRVGAFFSNVSTQLVRGAVDGSPGFEIDLEDVLGAPTTGTAVEVDAHWNIGRHHRLELGWFELVRDSTTAVDEDLVIGALALTEGSEARTKIDYSSLRLTYTFFLMRDNQKELGVMAGLHVTDLATNISAEGFPEVEKSRSSTPLPVIGLNGAVFIGDKTALRARVHIFRTDFSEYEGSLNYAALDLERRFGESVWAGIGYNYYGTKLASRDAGAAAEFEIRHHGPVIYCTVGF